MTLAISSNSPSITTDYTFKRNKTATIEQNDRLNSFLEILEKEEEEARNNELKKIEETFDTVNKQSEKVSSNEKTFSVDTELQKINAQKAYAK